MADIVTNMKVNSSGYEQGLKKAQESQRRFARGAKDAGKEVGTLGSAFSKFQGSATSLIGTLGKYAGTIGLAVGGFEALKGVIRGTQSTSDAFDQAIAACKVTVNNFFAALSSGDFSAFSRGINEMISRAAVAQAALDQLGNTLMSFNFINSEAAEALAAYQSTASDNKAGKAERAAAKREAQKKIGEAQTAANALYDDTFDAIKKGIGATLNIPTDKVTEDMVEYAIKLQANPATRDRAREEGKRIMKELGDAQRGQSGFWDVSTKSNYPFLGKTMGSAPGPTEGYRQQVKKSVDEYTSDPKKLGALIVYALNDRYSDEELNSVINQYQTALGAKRGAARMSTRFNKVSETAAKQAATAQNALNNVAPKTPTLTKAGKTLKPTATSTGGGRAAGRGTGGTGNLSQELAPQKGSLEDVKNLMNTYETMRDKFGKGTEQWNKYNALLDQAKATYDSIVGVEEEEAKALEGSLTYMEDLVSNLTKQRDMLVDGSDEWAKINSELEEAQKNLDAYNAKQNEAKTLADITDIMNAGNAEVNMLPEPKRLFTEEQQAQVKGYTEQINNLSTAYKALFDIMTDGSPKTQEVMDTLQTNIDEINTKLQSSKEALNQLFATGEQQQADNEMLAEKKQHWSDISSVVNGVGSVFTSTGNKSAKAIGTIIGQMGGLIGTYADLIGKSAAATVAGSGKGLVFPYNIIAITATLAAVMSAVSAAQSLAYGGIVGGSDFRDGISARVSSGEMVMNEADQRRLYDAIHTGNFGGGGGNSYVSGEQIVTVVNAWGRRTGRGEIIR
jgi:hypothetical protein